MKKFLFLLLLVLISSFGNALTGFTLGIWTLNHTTSTLSYALISFSAIAPQILLSPFIGSFIDRWDRKITIILGQAIAGVGTLMLILLVDNDLLSDWSIILIVLVQSICNGFITQAYYVSTKFLVPKKLARKAKGIEQIGFAIVRILAPILAPIMLAIISLKGLLYIDLLTYFITVFVFLFFNFGESREEIKRVNLFKDSTIVFSYLKSEKGLVRILGYYFITNLPLGMASVMIAPLVLDFSNEITLSIVMSIGGIGLLSGGLFASFYKGIKNPVAAVFNLNIFIGLVLFSCVFLYINSVLLSIAAFVLAFSITIINVLINSFWHVIVPHELDGRVMGYRTIIMGSAILLSYLLGGIIVDFLILPIVKYFDFKHLTNSLPNKTIAIMFLFSLLGILNTLVSIKYRKIKNIEKLDKLYIDSLESI